LISTVEMQDFDKNKFELIIVDDGSTDDTVAFLEEHQKKSNIKFNYYVQKNQGPGAARNNGMENARGDFFIFIDSDCTLASPGLMPLADQIHTGMIFQPC